MENSRRKFLQNASLALIGTGLMPNELWSKNILLERSKSLIGIQLYAVRDDMKKDPLATLTALFT